VDYLVREWRKRIGNIGRSKIDFFHREGATPYDIEIELSAPDPALLMKAAEALKKRMAAYPGVYDVSDSYVAGKPEVRLTLKPEAERLGLHLKDLAEQVYQSFLGEEAVRLLRGRDEVKVMVRYPLEERQSLDRLRAVPVWLPQGGEAPLGALAEVSFAPGYAQLTRQDRRRVLVVQARVDPQQTNIDALYADLEGQYFKSLEQRFDPACRAWMVQGGTRADGASAPTQRPYCPHRHLCPHRHSVSFLFATAHLHGRHTSGLDGRRAHPLAAQAPALCRIANRYACSKRCRGERQLGAA
jgi:hypothetical protein